MAAITEQRPSRTTRARRNQQPSHALRAPAQPTAPGPAVVLRLPPPLDPPVVDPPRLRLVAAAPAYDMDPLPLDWSGAAPDPQPAKPTPAPAPAPLPTSRSEAYKAAKRFTSLCVEVLNGYRPPNQLRPLAHPKKFGDISDQLLRRTVRIRMTPGQAARQGTLVRIRRLLLTEPKPGIAEGVVVLEHGPVAWAMAIRMEKQDRPNTGVLGWICTVVTVI
ncbi:Rv3235 family protein [Dactylosporangium sp. CS-047395]|uniref:Rv3235 family protein n=1 Tax=Dactylosporangium sp. CS-047395 TaxID=3239936 RepID=UPI003D8C3AED